MNKKKKAPPAKAGAPAWMVSWSDLVTVLYALFVLLFAMSQTDEDRFAEFAEAMAGRRVFLAGALGTIFNDSSGLMPLASPPSPPIQERIEEQDLPDEIDPIAAAVQIRRGQMEEMASNFRTYMAPYNDVMAELGITVDRLGEYVRIIFPSGMLFAAGQANLVPEAMEMIDYVASFLAQYPGYRISVQGHTDSDPINTVQFPSNFRLSAARAEAVVGRLIYQHGFDPALLYPSGLGEFRPVDTNDTPEGRANNRRVEILVHAPQQSLTLLID